MKNTNTQAQVLTLTPEELSALIANATAQAVAQALSRTQTHTQAPVQASTPIATPEVAPTPVRTYEHVSVVFDNFVVKADKKFVDAFVRTEYVLTDAKGKKSVIKADTRLAYAYGHKDAWDAFKARMRKAGGAYDAQTKAWVFPSAKAAKAFSEGEGAKPITVEELNAVRDNWTRKAEKRANKAE